MDTIDKILILMKNNNIEQKTLAEAIGVRKQAITEWKNGTTKSYMKYIDKIADYFNVSTDYLLNGADKPVNINITVKLKDFEEIASQLSDDEVEKLYEYMKFLISQRKDDE